MESVHTDGEKREFDGFMLAEENEALKPALSGYLNGYPLEILNFISSKNLSASVDFTNFCIALQIFLTMTVASGERGFSKLKLMKSSLRFHNDPRSVV